MVYCFGLVLRKWNGNFNLTPTVHTKQKAMHAYHASLNYHSPSLTYKSSECKRSRIGNLVAVPIAQDERRN